MSRREDFEAAIENHPDVADNYLVYGDWLQEQQDPRGELIGLCRDATDEVAKARINTLQRELGPPSPRYGSQEWFYGFVRSMRTIVDEDDQDALRETLDHPSLRFITKLEFELAGSEHDDCQWLIELIAEKPRRAWRHLHIYSYRRGGNDPPAGSLDLTPLWSALPWIRIVYAGARWVTPGDGCETLETLDLDGGVLAPELEPLLRGSAPNLRSLTLHDVAPASFASVLDSVPTTLPLTRLVLPHASAAVKERIHRRYPSVTFLAAEDGDRYEQTGE